MEINSIKKMVGLLTIPLIFTLGIAAIFYPGFMSYDTLHALHGARDGVTDSMWPPMVSYVWRVIDLVSHNPSAMHFSQVFLLLFSVFCIVFQFTKKISYAALFLVLYLSIPAILGTVAVIWKDVLMAAFFLASFAAIVSMRHTQTRRIFIFLSLLVILLIFLGVCSRHNAITGAIPLIFFLAWVVCRRIWNNPLHLWLSVIVLGSALTGSVFFTKLQLDRYSLPHLVKMKSSTNEFLQSVRVLDIAGASLCVGSNLFENMAPNLSLKEIEQLYQPKHINLSAGLLSRIGYDAKYNGSEIDRIWYSIAIHHPICFFYNKYQLMKFLIAANQGVQFLITAPSVDTNDYGYILLESSLRDSIVTYIVQASQRTYLKPWFLYLVSVGALIIMACARRLTVEYFVIVVSAVFYFGSLVMFGNAADARLPFYTTTALFIFTFASLLQWRVLKHPVYPKQFNVEHGSLRL